MKLGETVNYLTAVSDAGLRGLGLIRVKRLS